MIGMIKEARSTAVWLWGVVLNPDVVWVDPKTNEESSRERWSRRARWRLLRPVWMYTFLTTKESCGCARRFGLWRVLLCVRHASVKLGIDE